MKHLFLYIILFVTKVNFAQNEPLYLNINNPQFTFGCEEELGFGFALKSNDEIFITDYFKFGIPNESGFDDTGKVEYYTVKEMKKKVKIDTIKFQTLEGFTKDKSFWKIHNELSLKKQIYLLEKVKIKNYSNNKGDSYQYFMIPMIYEGTRKNIVPTSH